MSRENRHSIAYSSNQAHRGVPPSSIPQSSSQVHARLNRSRASTLTNNPMSSEPLGVAHPHPPEWHPHLPVSGPALPGYPPTGHLTDCMYPPTGATLSPAPSLYQSVLCAQQGRRPDDGDKRRSSLPIFNPDQTSVPPVMQQNGDTGAVMRGHPVVSTGMSNNILSDQAANHPLHHYSLTHHPVATDQGQVPPSADTMSPMVSGGGFGQPGSSFSPHPTGDASYPNATYHYHSPSHQRRRSVRHAHRKSQQYPTSRPSVGNITRLSDEFHKRTRIQDHPPPPTGDGSGGEMQDMPHSGTLGSVSSGFQTRDTFSNSLATQSMFDLRHPPPTISLGYSGANDNVPTHSPLSNADTRATGGNGYPLYSPTQPKINQSRPPTYTQYEPYTQSSGVPTWENNHSTILSEPKQSIRKYPPGTTGHCGPYGALTVPNSSTVETANHRSRVNKRWMSRSFDASTNESGSALPSSNGNPAGPSDLNTDASTQEQRFPQNYQDNLGNARGRRNGTRQIRPMPSSSTIGFAAQPHKLSQSFAHLPVPPKSPTGMPQSGGYEYAATWGRRSKHRPLE
ncbi:hypothetical protein IWQ61_009318 [Dispira simplex]|nr:hypothetical protein IWQ61_009318 [Dispira simplex]